jgi:hypothetical protein
MTEEEQRRIYREQIAPLVNQIADIAEGCRMPYIMAFQELDQHLIINHFLPKDHTAIRFLKALHELMETGVTFGSGVSNAS